MPNSGNTGLIPDCLGHQDSTWKITYNVPSPGGVRYQYSDEDWKMVVGGVSFQLTQINQRPSNVQKYLNGPYALVGYGTFVISGRGATCRNTFKTVNSPEGYLMRRTSPYSNSCGSGQTLYYLVTCENIEVNLQHTIDISGWTSHSLSSQIKTSPCEDKCRFEIFNSNNQVIYTETRDVCPTAEVVQCYLDPDNEKTTSFNPQSVATGFKTGLVVSDYLLETDGRKGTKVEAVKYPLPNLPGASTTILDLYSPSGCNIHPKITWDCDGGCQGGKCPSGTCLKILNRATNKICCYGKGGKLLGTADPDCETSDCTC